MVLESLPNGETKVRMCIDYRGLNAVTKRDYYPLLDLHETIEQYFHSSALFSVLDISQAFHLIEIEECDKEKTGFSTTFGHYEYNKLPFGLMNSPATFQRYINSILSGLIIVLMLLVYMDDIIVFSLDGMKEHLRRVEVVFEKLQEANIRLKPDKCKFLVQEVKFLGHYHKERRKTRP